VSTEYTPLGPVRPDGTQTVHVVERRPMLRDGVLYELQITGTAELTRGPLGRFLDLAGQIEAEGLKVPPEIRDLLDELAERKD
jgi:hypothetical protein